MGSASTLGGWMLQSELGAPIAIPLWNTKSFENNFCGDILGMLLHVNG